MAGTAQGAAGIGKCTRFAMPFTAGSHIGYCSVIGQAAVLIAYEDRSIPHSVPLFTVQQSLRIQQD